MKVLMQIRKDAFAKFGGDTFQMLKYQEHLRRLSVKVEISRELRPSLDGADIVHLFNLDRPLETYVQLRNARVRGRPSVLSSIHRPMAHVRAWEGRRDGIEGFVRRFFPSRETFETAKDFVRAVRGRAYLGAWWMEMRTGLLRQQREIVAGVDAVCLLADGERAAIEEDTGATPARCRVIPNGCETDASSSALSDETLARLGGVRDFVLAAGRIESGKNPLGVVEALKDVPLPVVFAGGVNRWHRAYAKRFISAVEAAPNMRYIGRVPSGEMPALYALAKVHVLASWFEAAPLVDLEAARRGCNVVTTLRSYAPSYAADFARFCDPSDPADIREAVLAAYESPRNSSVPRRIRERFSWEKAAESLRELYREVLAQKRSRRTRPETRRR